MFVIVVVCVCWGCFVVALFLFNQNHRRELKRGRGMFMSLARNSGSKLKVNNL